MERERKHPNCARCGLSVKPDSDYIRASKWTQSASFHWQCWLTLLSERDQVTALELVRQAEKRT